MITSFMANNELHAVRVIAQKGLTQIRAVSFCAIDGDAGAGVYQVADWAFDGRPKYKAPAGAEVPVCGKCSQVLIGISKAPPP